MSDHYPHNAGPPPPPGGYPTPPPQQGYGQPQAYGQPYAQPYAGQPPYAQPHGMPAYGYPPYPGGHDPSGMPMTMPGPVRTAQVLGIVMGALVLVGVLASGAVYGAEAAGYAIGVSLPAIGAFICALQFKRGGNGAKVTAVVFDSLMMFFGLGSFAQGNLSGGLHFVFGLLGVILLSQRVSGAWFRRDRALR
ncbi:hypothetical protein [Streptomyces sp. URMC 123]|uniref:hypothetical protein n=1 Tax=Streptomyces sp. URMC 123 TaxID=3423403 RepID=UPI003F1C121E